MGTPTSSRGPARCARRAARGAALAFVPRRAACFRFRQRREDPAKAKLDGVEMACMMGSYPAQPNAVILSRLGGPRAARPTPDAIRGLRARLEHLAVSAVPSTGVRKARGAIVGAPSQTVRVRWHTAPVSASERRFGRFDFIPQVCERAPVCVPGIETLSPFGALASLATKTVPRRIPRALFRQRSPHACDSSNSKWTKSSCE